MTKDFIYDKRIYNTNSAKVMVPLIMQMYDPKSVIDIGCGIGTWGVAFEENGIDDYMGVDGDYVNRELLMIEDKKFRTADLTKEFSINRKYDLAISLEVAEHLPESSADIFIKTLVALSDTIIFSAAVQGQGGQNHLNEQFPHYWQEKFAKHDYELVHSFSSGIWNNQEIEWWYRQNTLVYKKRIENQQSIELKFFIHPELYKSKLSDINVLKIRNQEILKGKITVLQSLKIFIRSFLHIFN